MTDRQEIRDRRRKRKKQKRLNAILIITGAVFVLVSILMLAWIRQELDQSDDFIQPVINPRPMQDRNAMGDPDALVLIEVFSDFTCVHCRTFALITGEEISLKYVATGQVYFVFNSVGSILGHPNAAYAAEAAYCAGDQDFFWEFHDLLYANQSILFSNINRKIDKIMISFAELLGLDLDRFDSCLVHKQFQDDVHQDQVEAHQAGIIETPSILINGKLFQGNWADGELEAAIDTALENENR